MGRTKEQRSLSEKGFRKCSICGEVKTKEDFHIKRNYKDAEGNTKYSSLDTRCKSCMKAYTRNLKISSEENYCRLIIPSLRYRAKTEAVAFDLTGEYLLEQWYSQEGKCFYTGAALDLTHQPLDCRSPHRLFPSLDRKVPSLGYTKGNVVWCTYVVNRMKNDLTFTEFIDFCKLMAARF